MQKFTDVLSRWERRELSAMDAGEILGVSERQFRRYRQRYEEEGLSGLLDRRLGKASAKRVPVDEIEWMLDQYRTEYSGWNVQHFHEHLQKRHGFRGATPGPRRSCTRPARGVHRRKRPRKPCVGMMLHQDGSRAEWLAGTPALDLIVTMDDATNELYSALLVEEEGTVSTFRACREVFAARGLPSSLYTDRGSHYFFTPKAGGSGRQGAADPSGPGAGTAGDRAHRSLFARGAGLIGAHVRDPAGPAHQGAGESRRTEIAAANRSIREVYLPDHNARFAKPPQLEDSAFVAVTDAASLAEILCIEQERIVARDNTVTYDGRSLQLPERRARAHYVKARVKVRAYPDCQSAPKFDP